MVGRRLAGCGLKHRHRKWANTKPCVCLRKRACERSGFLLLHPHVIQKLWLGRTPGRPLPRAGSPAHHASPIAFFLALLQFGVTLKPLLTRASGCELYQKRSQGEIREKKKRQKRQGQQDLARNIGGRAFHQLGKQYKKRSEAVLLRTNQNLKGQSSQSQTTSKRKALHVAPWHL